MTKHQAANIIGATIKEMLVDQDSISEAAKALILGGLKGGLVCQEIEHAIEWWRKEGRKTS